MERGQAGCGCGDRAAGSKVPPLRPDLWSRTVDAWYRTMSRHQRFRCPHCEYDLRGLPAPGGYFRCPECGALIERYKAMVPDAPAWGRWDRYRRPVLAALMGAGLVALVFGPPLVKAVVVLIAIALAAQAARGLRSRRALLRDMPAMFGPSQRTSLDRDLTATLKAGEGAKQ